MYDAFAIGMEVFNSPAGPGKITGITESGYLQVDHIAVVRLAVKIKDNEFAIYDANGSYARGDWEMFIDDERFPSSKESPSVVIVRSSLEAIAFCQAVKSLPRRIMFDHDLGGDDTSMRFINWMISQLYEDNPTFTLREDFTFSVHSQNPVGANNIADIMQSLLSDYFKKSESSFIAFSLPNKGFDEQLREAIAFMNVNRKEDASLQALRIYVIFGLVAFDNLIKIRLWSAESDKPKDMYDYFYHNLSVMQVQNITHLPQGFNGYVLDTKTKIVIHYKGKEER